MDKKLPELFATINQKLTVIKDIKDNNENLVAKIGDQFYIENIIGYGFDLVSTSKPEERIRMLNSNLINYFIIEK